jgi:hypothetical protein
VTKGEATPGAARPPHVKPRQPPDFSPRKVRSQFPTVRPLRQSTMSRLGKVSLRRVPFSIPPRPVVQV